MQHDITLTLGDRDRLFTEPAGASTVVIRIPTGLNSKVTIGVSREQAAQLSEDIHAVLLGREVSRVG